MQETLFSTPIITDVQSKMRRARISQTIWYLVVVGLVGAFAALIVSDGADPSDIAWSIYLLVVLFTVYRPRYGIYFMLFFALSSDFLMTPNLPFIQSFSNDASYFYVEGFPPVSPLEIHLVVTPLLWLISMGVRREFKIHFGRLFWPMALFMLFVIFGVAYGFTTGGNYVIGLWEVRPIFYFPIMMILASNLLEEKSHYSNVMWVIMLALFTEGMIGTYQFFTETGAEIELVGDYGQHHTAAQHINTLLLFVLAAWLYRGSLRKRFYLFLLFPPVFLTYFIAQRRAAFLTLIVALVLMAIPLFKERRLSFWMLVPTAALIGVLYTGIFWNSTHPAGMAAQAIKSVVAQDSAADADRQSNEYREIENLNLLFTIRQHPLTGVGFGKKFYIIFPLADISFFEFWEYITHNSILWIWVKTGVLGFIALLAMVGYTIMEGIRVTFALQDRNLKAIALTLTLFVVMYFIYGYVDFAWEGQSMLYIGVTFGMLNSLERVDSKREKAGVLLGPDEASLAAEEKNGR